MALTDEQLELLGNRLIPLYQELEQDVIADIARRVKKTGRYTETAELMARALMEQGYSPARIQREVMKVLRADKEYQMAVAEHTKEYKQYVASEISRVVAEAKEQGNGIVADAGNMAFNADLSMWEQAGKSLSQPSGFHRLVDAMALQTNGELKNLTKSLGFKNVGFTALENVYQHQLDLGLIKLTSGAYSWQRVVDDCVRELAQSGLRTIDYKSGRSMQLDTAVRNCIRTASGQLAGKVTMLNMDSTGESLVEVSQHWGARSDGSCGHGDHAYWQGKVYATDHGRHVAEARRLGYSIRNLEDATGYPSDPLGLCGYNCRHTFYAFFEGVSEPNQWEPEPEPVMVNGREYDYYHATQRQRQMERQIRATKREIEAQRALGGDTKELQSRLRKQTADYKRFSADVDIRPKNERLRVQAGSSDINVTKSYQNLIQSFEKASKNDTINIELQFFASKEKQYGKKIGKHAQDFGLDASKEADRLKMEHIIADIVSNKDEIRIGSWRGQHDDVLFFVKGNDVVITKTDGEFVTILKDGVKNSAGVKNAGKR
ncbi:MAG: phage minor capsid protein [Roseburia sp.]